MSTLRIDVRITTTIRTAANLGVNYKDSGQVPKALPLLEEA